jgi:hypothetical protein
MDIDMFAGRNARTWIACHMRSPEHWGIWTSITKRFYYSEDTIESSTACGHWPCRWRHHVGNLFLRCRYWAIRHEGDSMWLAWMRLHFARL